MTCPRCTETEQELARLRDQLVAAGRDPVDTADDVDHTLELAAAAWLATGRHDGAAAGYRAGWAAYLRFIGPQLRQWQALWRAQVRERDQLRARQGNLLREISRLTDTG